MFICIYRQIQRYIVFVCIYIYTLNHIHICICIYRMPVVHLQMLTWSPPSIYCLLALSWSLSLLL